MNNEGPRILLIRFSSLGDLVILSALVEGIAAVFPGSELHLVTKEEYAGLYIQDKRVAAVRMLPGGSGIAGLLSLRRELSREHFDIILDAHNVIRSNLLYRTLRAGRKAQLRKDQVRKVSLIRAGVDLYMGAASMKDRYLGLLASIGAAVPEVSTRIDPPPEALAAAVELIRSGGIPDRRLVVLAPGARWETKRWPARRFAEIAASLSAKGYGTVVIGEAREKGICAEAASCPGVLDACGRLSLMETAALLSRASALVTNDSAPLHMAEAVGTPVVALFGPTVRQFGYYPLLGRSIVMERDIGCRPCSRNGARPCHIEKRECLESIGAEEVTAAVERLLGCGGGEG